MARALAQVVLPTETIVRHATTALPAPELVEVRGSALDLWTSVLGRAEAEGCVQALVNAVLEENKAAEELKAALRGWLEAASEPSLPPPSDALPRSRPLARTAPRGAPVLRWIAAVFGAALLAALLLHPRALRRWLGALRGTSTQQLALAPGREPTPAELEAELVACWRGAEGGEPPSPRAKSRRALDRDTRVSSSIQVRLGKGAGGEDVQRLEKGALLEDSSEAPRFYACAETAMNRLLSRLAPGTSIQADIELPPER